MDFENYSQYFLLLKKYWLPAGLGTLGLMLLVSGLISSLNSKPEQIIFNSAQETKANPTKNKIVVDVSGAVIKPGIYSEEEGARIQDALISAGGLAQNADRDWISKNVNLAQKLTDASKIYIPKIGEQVTAASGFEAKNSININSASLSELDSLPGIGPVTAQKIIDNRPYSSVDELLSKKVLTQKIFDKIKPNLSAY